MGRLAGAHFVSGRGGLLFRSVRTDQRRQSADQGRPTHTERERGCPGVDSSFVFLWRSSGGGGGRWRKRSGCASGLAPQGGNQYSTEDDESKVAFDNLTGPTAADRDRRRIHLILFLHGCDEPTPARPHKSSSRPTGSTAPVASRACRSSGTNCPEQVDASTASNVESPAIYLRDIYL